jgi:hypothetical protein
VFLFFYEKVGFPWLFRDPIAVPYKSNGNYFMNLLIYCITELTVFMSMLSFRFSPS